MALRERMQEADLRAVRQLAAHLRTPPDQLTELQLRDYFLLLKNEKRFATSALMIAYCGIKYKVEPPPFVSGPASVGPSDGKINGVPEIMATDANKPIVGKPLTGRNAAQTRRLG